MRRATLIARALFVLVASGVPSAFGQGNAPQPAQATAAGQSPTAQSPDVPDWQTKAGGKMSFEVAAIHQSQMGAHTMPNFPNTNDEAYIHSPNDSYIADSSVVGFIQFAYKITLTIDQMHAMTANLPASAKDTYVIRAKAAQPATKDQMRLMVQSLLAERFKLAVHFEKKVGDVCGLTLVEPGKPGPKLIPHDKGPACEVEDIPMTPRQGVEIKNGVFPPVCDVFRTTITPKRTFLTGSRNTTMELLANSLGASTLVFMGEVDRPVIDQTGLSGRYDFTLEWADDANNVR